MSNIKQDIANRLLLIAIVLALCLFTTVGHAQTTPLHEAARTNNLDEITKLLKQGVDVNERDNGNKSPLHWAASRGHIDTVKLLIENGADVNLQSKNNATPVDYAIEAGYIDLARFMLSKGAKFGARNADLQHEGALDNIMTLEDMLRKLFPREKNTVSKIDIPLTGRIKTDYVFYVPGSSYAIGAYVFRYSIDKKQGFLRVKTKSTGVSLNMQKSKLVGSGKTYCRYGMMSSEAKIMDLDIVGENVVDLYVKRENSCGSGGCSYWFTYGDRTLLNDCIMEGCSLRDVFPDDVYLAPKLDKCD